ncbi:MAG: hypothetical protein ACFCU3_09085 [Verrucomicrobiales bacterium]
MLAIAGTAWWGWQRALDYLHGEELTVLVGNNLQRTMKWDAELMPFSWEGSEAQSSGATAKGLDGAWLQSLKADLISTKFNMSSLWEGAWHLEHVTIEKATLRLGPGSGQGSRELEPVDQADREPAWYAQYLPSRSQLDKVHLEETQLQWDGGQWTGAEVLVKPRGDRWQVDAQGGLLSTDEEVIPSVTVQKLIALAGSEGVTIEEAAVLPAGGGQINASGQVKAGGVVEVDLRIRELPVKPFLTEAQGQQINGKLQADVEVVREANQAWSSQGRSQMLQASLTGVPALDRVANILGMPEYRDLRFQTVSMNYKWQPGRTAIDQLVVEAEGLLKVEGAFVLVGNDIEGIFEVGVPPRALRRLPGAASQVFQRDEGGYRWARVEIKGPLANPQQDLVSRLIAAPLLMPLDGLVSTVSAAGGVALEGGGFLVNQATQVVTGGGRIILEGAGSVLRGGGRVLEEGGRGVLGIIEGIIPGRSRGAEED